MWKHRWLDEQISDETRGSFIKNPAFLIEISFIENENPFNIGAFANTGNENYPTTPTYQSDSDSENETSHDDSNSSLIDDVLAEPQFINCTQLSL